MVAAAAFALPALSAVAVAGDGSTVRRSLPPSSGVATAVATCRSDFLGRSLSLPAAGAGAALPSPGGGSSLSVFCGRGDRKTEKGKRFNHSYGNARPRDKKKGRGPPRVEVPPAPPRKDKYDDGEIVKIEIDESLFS